VPPLNRTRYATESPRSKSKNPSGVLFSEQNQQVY
jgi:hypothetical protein